MSMNLWVHFAQRFLRPNVGDALSRDVTHIHTFVGIKSDRCVGNMSHNIYDGDSPGTLVTLQRDYQQSLLLEDIVNIASSEIA